MAGNILHASGKVLHLGEFAEVSSLIAPDFGPLRIAETSATLECCCAELKDERTQVATSRLIFLVRRSFAASQGIRCFLIAVVHPLGKTDDFEFAVGKAFELQEIALFDRATPALVMRVGRADDQPFVTKVKRLVLEGQKLLDRKSVV